ncbi:MAG: amino acid ABC transporter substrate-binding protein [Bacteroidota bacterium]|nr:amino acid ABC transporter substrate-binding protein [Bacteroidota bacterium]
MKKYFRKKWFFPRISNCPLPIACCLLSIHALAQTDSLHPSKHKIAIFAPLYLDSAFDAAGEYRYTKNVFPKFINPGLEFYEGARLALDSLEQDGKELEIFVYDSRSSKETLQNQLNKPEINDVELIIAHCSGNEVRTFADAGLKKNIPVINVTIPQDGGVSGNPFFIILNPMLKTHCEGIYKYIQKYYSIEPIVVFRKKGELENQIREYFDNYGKSTKSVPLKIKYVDLPDNFTANQLSANLDSTHHTLCVAGSLDGNFGRQLALQLASLYKQYHITIMGMPTWDGLTREFSKPDFKGPEIIYSTPFYNPRTDKVSLDITNHFNTVMYARPSDMVFRGYEVTWKFAKLLLQYGKDISTNLSDNKNNVFTDFDIQPELNRQNMRPDHFENKKLYFIKWQDGLIKGVN